MSLRMLLRRGLWKMLSFLGAPARRWIWNDQFRQGQWDCLRADRRKRVIELVEELAKGGRIVELACGEGILISAINPEVYDSYLGIDISDVALEAAVKKTQELGLFRCRFKQLDIADWPGDSELSLVILEECLYYLNAAQQRQLLSTCLNSLSPSGAVVVTFYSRARHERSIETCKEFYPTTVDVPDGDHVYLVLRAGSSRMAVAGA